MDEVVSNDSKPTAIYEALRVSQLDAAELDTELFTLIKLQLRNVFKYFKPEVLVKFGPELDAALRYVFWHYSVRTAAATVGQKLLSLKYVDELNRPQQWMSDRQRILFAVFTIGGPWLQERIDDFAAATRNISHVNHLWEALRLVSSFWRAASLLNFLVFLTRGRYVSLLERLLGARSVFPQRRLIRQVGFEMMDRELLWHGFAEFLFFLLPLINIQKVKNFVLRTLFPKTSAPTSVSPLDRPASAYKECVVCTEWPIHPHYIDNCPHVFCYFCLQSNYKADSNFACPVCGTKVTSPDSIKPVVLPVTITKTT